MGHETSLVPNFTFFIQLGIFIACYLVLRFLVFIPYMRLVHLREERTSGLKAKAVELSESGKKFRADYEATMREERKKLTVWAEEERHRIANEERALIQAARENIGAELQKVRDDIQSQSSKARTELLPHISDYSSSIATKLLGHAVKVPPNASPRAEGKAEQVV